MKKSILEVLIENAVKMAYETGEGRAEAEWLESCENLSKPSDLVVCACWVQDTVIEITIIQDGFVKMSYVDETLHE